MPEDKKSTEPTGPVGKAKRRKPRRPRWLENVSLRRVGRVLILSGLVVVSCGALFTAGTWLTLKATVQVPEVRMPDLSGLDVNQAGSRLEELGLIPQVSGRQFDPLKPVGQVLEHYPPEGARTKPGRPVRLIVSRGPARAIVPDLAGSSLRRATLALRAAEMHVTTTSSVPDASVPLGRVIAQNPPAGSEGYPGDGAALLLSAGPPEEAFLMPVLIGWERGAAQALLDKRGVRRVSTTGPPGSRARLVSQWPAPGTKVSLEQRVTLEAGPRPLDPEERR